MNIIKIKGTINGYLITKNDRSILIDAPVLPEEGDLYFDKVSSCKIDMVFVTQHRLAHTYLLNLMV